MSGAGAILGLPDRVTALSPREPPPAPALTLQFPGGALPLQGTVSIGADSTNQVALDDRYVSRFHCRLHPRAGRFLLEDLDSTNGTFLDGARIRAAQVEPGSRIRLGSQELRIESAGPRALASLPGLLACDPALAPALELLRRAAPSSLPITILGESGTGKEVAARAVHRLSSRGGGPFVPLNCGAIARELAEAELFGHERGSFTGAVASAPGAFGAADGGTLFLDEIGDLPPDLQVKLLRALESGEVKPVGAPRPRRIDVRVICATHRDLRARVREGAFREDLFYRLRGLTVELPPLRARPQDILPLAEHFLPEGQSFAPETRAALLSHRWPGNVRELRHVVQLAALLSETPVIRAHALRFDDAAPGAWGPRVCEPEDAVHLRGRTLGELEEIAIRSAFVRHGGNRRAVSAELGIARSSLLRKLDLLRLRP
ncbi:MAG TPA: sigma 54-interacting transcriptional regulator [Myxococcales bacterium]|nr:sigma 54-interacting transcriptional regulator [Myxococcales bacterium]